MRILMQYQATVYLGQTTPPKEVLELSLSTDLADYFENPNLACLLKTTNGDLLVGYFVLVEPKDSENNPLVSFWEIGEGAAPVAVEDVIWWQYIPLMTFEEE